MSSPTPPLAQTAEKTLALLWERVRQQGDLPGFAKAISSILSAMRGEEDLEFNMTQTVLSDPALTQKVLRLANSAMYAAFGQKISTISKAVVVLGTETIGHLALGLKLIDELSAASPSSSSAQLQMEKAVLAGHVARQVATSANCHDAEEAVVCSMLHSLGRMMVVFYLADRWNEIRQQCKVQAPRRPELSESQLEDEIATHLLHISLEEIGHATARRWGFPASLINTMRQMPPRSDVNEPLAHADWLAALSTMSVGCADALCDAEDAGSEQIARLATDYAGMLGVPAEKMQTAIECARQNSAAELTAVHVARRANTEKRAGGASVTAQSDLEDLRQKQLSILRQGVADMHEVIGLATPGQLMTMALETVYQGLRLKRAVAFMHSFKDGKYVGKISFGAGMHAMLPHLVFEDSHHADVFKAAVVNDKLIYIEHAKDPDFAAKLPHWWKSTLQSAQSFLVLPLSLGGHPAGFIYGDWADEHPPFGLHEAEFQILNDIRNCVIQALERRRQAASNKQSGAPR